MRKRASHMRESAYMSCYVRGTAHFSPTGLLARLLSWADQGIAAPEGNTAALGTWTAPGGSHAAASGSACRASAGGAPGGQKSALGACWGASSAMGGPHVMRLGLQAAWADAAAVTAAPERPSPCTQQRALQVCVLGVMVFCKRMLAYSQTLLQRLGTAVGISL